MSPIRQPHVAIIGSGFAGIAVAAQLKRAGHTSFTIFERAPGVGGVWRDNTYPGAACDVPSHLYSYSFVPEPTWRRRFAEQPEILRYLRRCVEQHRLTRHLRLNTAIEAADYDERTRRWRLRTGSGEVVDADVLVPAVGQLSEPLTPDLPGLGDFAGPMFHSARWDHQVDLRDKRVAVIGTGASAVQFVPAIAGRVRELTVFQRSAPHVVPRPDRAYRPWHRFVFRNVPGAQSLARFGVWSFFEAAGRGLTTAQPIGKMFSLVAGWHRSTQLRAAQVSDDLAPDHPIGCKRVLFSSEYYPAFNRPGVRAETSRIERVTPHGLRTADGTEHPADVVIFGTGFDASNFLSSMAVRGVGGTLLDEVWEQGARAYLGMAVPRFPNMFVMYGPNTNLGSGSVVHMLESQAKYVVRLVRRLARRPGAALEVLPEAAERFDREIQQRLRDSVFTSCRSWYRDESGRISTNWPGSMTEYRRRTRCPDLSDYQVLAPSTT
ncbi:NAD(P)/FAD-dependent oxidoreductase [Saccharopolyspora sp. NFXS83]|uniref:flavin-containing monooxygenase n=1 Tax=Saccharopolyspora sp. NFXS83 TaxID=2993560 RepID=UPI00224B75C5|nr:NAD(P)/FAD-dependent oxidoreductase [Saccharopolyspora sp. NFXS83]MCX2730054.1 NAD(P)/FAD-dependent oxidoreductase [Saccharopolyspora sp. NFXS83]